MKYLPENFLSDAQKTAKKEALAEDEAKIAKLKSSERHALPKEDASEDTAEQIEEKEKSEAETEKEEAVDVEESATEEEKEDPRHELRELAREYDSKRIT